MILVLDNYDSFTYNLVQAIGSFGVSTVVARNDEISATDLVKLNPAALVLSPGPGRPEDAGNMPDIVASAIGRLPVLGICLGLQMLALHYGAHIVTADHIVHGKATPVFHDGRTSFRDLTNPFDAGRYHSLLVESRDLPTELEVSAWTADREVMGLRHRTLPVEGVQFHPESILTPQGQKLLANFFSACGILIHH
ncbi:MAG: aminodeoxychorismate/anthranilate synthase component II [bacterium]|nr:aminodeoxychorismate/anthranilate synthase component II [bacterium]